MLKNTKIFILAAFLFFIFSEAEAADLAIFPSEGSYAVGENFSIEMYVKSPDQVMNAASGVLSFPKDKLEIVSLSKTGSITSLWVQEPSFSNQEGNVSFEGIVLNPGYIGASGKILTIVFKAKAAGLASVIFSSGSVLANDGNGTNILKNLNEGQFYLGKTTPSVPSATTGLETGLFPSAPVIASKTHSNPLEWYAKKDAVFYWDLPNDATGVRLSVDKLPVAIPTVAYSPTIKEKEVKNMEDGVWYFHAQFKNSYGWGSMSHFRYQIDTENPYYFSIEEAKRDDLTEPAVEFVFSAKDKTSGISHYEAAIDDSEFKKWETTDGKRYVTPVLEPGRHKLMAKAFDKAGNFLTDFQEFEIKSLKPPEIIDYPQKLQIGEIITAGGRTYPDSKVAVWLKKDNDAAKNYEVKSDNNGNFILKSPEKSEEGVYTVWAKVTDKRGAQSFDSDKRTFSAERGPIIKIGYRIIAVLAVIIPLAALVIGLIFLILYSRRKFFALKKKVEKETVEAENILHKTFDDLKESVKKEILQLEKIQDSRDLTPEEERIIQKLRKDLNVAEESINKEIKDISE